MSLRQRLPIGPLARPRSRRFALLAVVATAALAFTMAGTASAGPSKVTYVFTNITLSGANHLTFGYVAEGNDHYIFNSGIGFLRRLTVTLPVGTALTVLLIDETCGATYYADGTGAANHATTIPTKRGFTIDIADAGGSCANQNVTNQPAVGGGNLTLTEVVR